MQINLYKHEIMSNDKFNTEMITSLLQATSVHFSSPYPFQLEESSRRHGVCLWVFCAWSWDCRIAWGSWFLWTNRLFFGLFFGLFCVIFDFNLVQLLISEVFFEGHDAGMVLESGWCRQEIFLTSLETIIEEDEVVTYKIWSTSEQ